MKSTYSVLVILTLVCENKASRTDVNHLIELSQNYAHSYLKYRYKNLSKILMSEDVTLQELAIDAIAPLFERNDDGSFVKINKSFNDWIPKIETEEQALFFLNRVVAKSTEKYVSELLRQSDPFFSRILDSITYLIEKQNLKKKRIFGTTYIVEDADVKKIGSLPDSKFMNELPIYLFSNNDILSELFKYLKTSTDKTPAIPLNALVMKLKQVITTELLPPGRPLLAAALRALPAGLALATITRRRPTGSWWWKAASLGVLNIGAFFVLLFVAAYRLPGGVAATLGAVQPLVAAALAAAFLGERLRRSTVAAGMLGVVGVGLLVLRSDAAVDTVGVLAGLTGALSMASGVVLTKHWGRPVPLAAFTSWQLIAGGVLLAPIALAVEGPPPPLTGQNLIGFAWLATGGAAVSYLVWFRGVARLPVAQVSLLGLMSPIVATVAGLVVLGQTLTPAQLLGAGLVLTAIWVGQRAVPSQKTNPATRPITKETNS